MARRKPTTAVPAAQPSTVDEMEAHRERADGAVWDESAGVWRDPSPASAFVRFVRDDAPFRRGDALRVRQVEAEKFVRHGVAVIVGE